MLNDEDPGQISAAIFYSISSTQKGLQVRRIPLTPRGVPCTGAPLTVGTEQSRERNVDYALLDLGLLQAANAVETLGMI